MHQAALLRKKNNGQHKLAVSVPNAVNAFYIFTSSGCSRRKFTTVSAGRVMFLLPVKAAPAVPAPAPAAAPIAAPLPPPARAPIRAPAPAPPPIIVAERLPFPFIVRVEAAVLTL